MTSYARSAALLLVFIGCAGDPPTGLAPSATGAGPMVVWDPERRPEPEVPFPNDSATVLDPSSLTGRRLNLSVTSPLEVERHLRERLNRLDGFSLFGMITVSFDAPLDLATVTDESVLLIDVSPDSPEFGQRQALDLGRGAYPAAFRPRRVFPFDPDFELPDLVFPLDNTVGDERVEHWEVATNTLMIRPLRPLRPKTRYAVVLTRSVKGLNGDPVRSPFKAVNAAAQTDALKPAVAALNGGAGSISFAWVFTTQSLAENLVALREGLDGRGVFGWLKETYPGRIATVTNLGLDGAKLEPDETRPKNPFILNPDFLKVLLAPFSSTGYALDKVKFDHVDYFVYGSMEMPDLRSAEGGLWPNRATGEIEHKAALVPFTLSVPRTTDKHKPPFPVVLYSHGARTSRFELTLIANELAEQGLAALGIDAVGHGPFGGDIEAIVATQAKDYPPELVAFIIGAVAQIVLGDDYDYSTKTPSEIFDDLAPVGLWQTIFVDGRSEDLDGDGILLSGDGYFVPDSFALSGNSQQTLIDTMMVLRTLQRLDPKAVPKAVKGPETASAEALMPNLLAGDFNADGVLDVGGPDATFVAAGTSLGGIHTSVLMAVEPQLKAGVPIVSGGGMTDILVRTTLSSAVEPVLTEAIGPAVIGCPDAARDENAPVSLSWNNLAGGCDDPDRVARAEVGRAPSVPGGTVTLENPRLVNSELPEAADTAVMSPEGGFFVAVAADKGDPLVMTFRDADGKQVGDTITLNALHDGMARKRNTWRMRRLLQVAQISLDRGDPISWARHLIREPLPGMTPRNILHITDTGDRTVPFSSMVAWDRAAGLHGLTDAEALPVTDAFIERNALAEPGTWDIDDLFETSVGPGRLPVISTASGVSAVRHAPVDDHEFIALSDPKAEFDWGTYFRNVLARYLASGGTALEEAICLADGSCGAPAPE